MRGKKRINLNINRVFKISVLFLLLLIASVNNSYSQKIVGEKSISGIVMDEHGNPLPGAHVKEVGLEKWQSISSVATDINGHFSITVHGFTKQLEISFIGFDINLVTLTEELSYRIEMIPSRETLDEVVVTGVFTRRANTFTGAVASVKGEDLRRVGNQNVLQSLKNIDPSFIQIENLSSGSNPNALPDFTMRGSSTVASVQGEYASNPNQPLFILDGFEADLSKILDLDMNLVESLTTLKDATAKAIYGAKAANGVVVIETKRPESGRMRISYTGSLSVEAPDLTSYQLANAKEKLEIERMAGLFSSSNAVSQIELDKTYNNKLLEVLAGSNTDWLAQPVRTGVGQKHSFYLEGGDNDMLYGVDLSYNNIEGVLKGSNRTNFSGGITLSYRVNKLSFRNKLLIDNNISNESPWGTFSSYSVMNPYSRIHDENGQIIKSYQYTGNKGGVGTYFNPIYNSTLNTIDKSEYTNINNNFYLEWQLLSNLRLTGRMGFLRRLTSSDVFKPSNHTSFATVTDEFRKGSYYKSNGKHTNVNADAGVSYSVGINDHLLFVNGQLDISSSTYADAAMMAEGFPNDKMNDITFGVGYLKDGKPTGSEGISRNTGGLMSINYSYDDRYLLDANYRLSGSSETGANNRWGSFWSVGAGWNIHNEAFLKDSDILNLLKLRVSTGYTGSQGFSSYDAIPTFVYYSNSSYNGFIGSYVKGLANESLHWQEQYDTNFGLDFNLFRNRLSGRFDYYIADTQGMITNVTVPTASGFSTYVANLGETENKGYEINLNYKVFDRKNDYINVFGSLAHNKNKLKKISNGLSSWNNEADKNLSSTPSVKYYEGQSMSAIWAVRSLGIDPQTGNEIFMKNDGSVTFEYDVADQVVCGDTQPLFNGNIGVNGEISNFGISVIGGFRFGGQIYNQTLVDKVENAALEYNVDRRVFTDRWQKPGDMALYKSIQNQSVTYPTSRFVEDYNTFSLSSVSLYYDFRDASFLKKTFIERLKVSAFTNDLFIISSVKTERGTDYPFARNFSLSVQATF